MTAQNYKIAPLLVIAPLLKFDPRLTNIAHFGKPWPRPLYAVRQAQVW